MDNVKIYKLTNPQKNILLTEQYYKLTPINNVVGRIKFQEQIDINLLKKTLEIIIQQNDALRTRIIKVDGEYYQYFPNNVDNFIEIININEINQESKIVKELSRKYIKLINNNLMKFYILGYENGTADVLSVSHHIVDKVKGENELILMTKSAIKTSFLNKKIREKDQEIAKLSYKKAIMGNLIANLANEAKDQLMQISGMNESIKMSTNDYETENKVIENALKKTYELYEALNFENLQNIDVLQFNKIINILLKPTILLNNVNLSFETENKEIIINEASNNIYLIIKLVEILVENKSKDINIKVVEDNDKTYLLIIAEEIINSINLQKVELLSNGKDLNIENNIIKFRA